MKPKVAVIGAGSYVFSLSLLYDLTIVHQMDGVQLSLMDIDEEIACDMARIAERMASDAGINVQVAFTSDRAIALREADFVTVSVAVQLARRWHMDREIVERHGISEMLSECGGVGGLSQTLRAVPLVLGIVQDVERICPNAWVLNMTNPLPRVMTAVARHTSVRAIGFCNCAWGDVDGYGQLARVVGREKSEIDVTSAGLNHLSWLISIRDRKTGEDLMPAVHAAFAEGRGVGGRLSHKLWQDYGAVPLSGDSHVGEFIPYDPAFGTPGVGYHGREEERARRRREIRETAEGRRSWRRLLDDYGRAWERPADLIHSIVTGADRRMDMVNVPNCGCIDDLPDNAIVEIPARISCGKVHGERIGRLPGRVGDLCRQILTVHEIAAEAAVTGDYVLIQRAIESDIAIADKQSALKAIDEMLLAHADILPQFK